MVSPGRRSTKTCHLKNRNISASGRRFEWTEKIFPGIIWQVLHITGNICYSLSRTLRAAFSLRATLWYRLSHVIKWRAYIGHFSRNMIYDSQGLYRKQCALLLRGFVSLFCQSRANFDSGDVEGEIQCIKCTLSFYK